MHASGSAPMTEPLLSGSSAQGRGLRLLGVRLDLRHLAAATLALVALAGAAYLVLDRGSPPGLKGSPSFPAAEGPCKDSASCMEVIDSFLERQPRQTYMPSAVGLMQTFGPDSFGGGSCGKEMCELVEPCPNYQQTPHCRFDVYDNALAAIYLTKRGKISQARDVLGAFLELLYDESGKMVLLAASYTDAPAKAGEYQGVGVADGAVDTGNNAWIGLAFTHFAAATGEACYARVAREILAALKAGVSCEDDKFGGFASRLAPYPHFYRSTEHNIDAFSLARALNVTDDAASAATFVRARWGHSDQAPHTYGTGTGDDSRCDSSIPLAAAATDVQFWSLLADVDPDAQRKQASMEFALRSPPVGSTGPEQLDGLWCTDIDRIGSPDGNGIGAKVHGFRFTTWGNGIQWENTASAVMALAHYRDRFASRNPLKGLDNAIEAARGSILSLLSTYHAMPASVLGGNINAYIKNDHNSDYPGGSDTGIGWTYLRYPHVAASAWAGPLLMFDSNGKLNPDANPFGVPTNPVPSKQSSDADNSCIPARSGGGSGSDSQTDESRNDDGKKDDSQKSDHQKGGTNSDAACSAHAACKGLSGDCCPTGVGVMLGCCNTR